MEKIIILTISAFIATNLDDILILMAFFAHPDFNFTKVVLGQYIGFTILILISSLAYFTQFIISSSWISITGIFPIIIGIRNLMELKNQKKVKKSHQNFSPEKTSGKIPDKIPEKIPGKMPEKIQNSFTGHLKGKGFLSVAMVTLANGGDNLGVYIPLFANMDPLIILVTVILFWIMVGIWCILGFKLVNNQIIGSKIKNYGHIILPFVLIIIGIVILLNGGFFNLII